MKVIRILFECVLLNHLVINFIFFLLILLMMGMLGLSLPLKNGDDLLLSKYQDSFLFSFSLGNQGILYINFVLTMWSKGFIS